MNYLVTDKLKKLKFGDTISGTFLKGEYTHDIPKIEYGTNLNYVKMFLIYKLINNSWIAQPLYAEGLSSLRNMINYYDSKQVRNNYKK